MADRLMRPGRDPGVTVKDAGFDDDFIGFASTPAAKSPFIAAPPATEKPPILEAPAAELTSETVPETKPELPPQAEPESPARIPPTAAPTPVPAATPVEPVTSGSATGALLDRIHHFRDWMQRNFSATGIFILDRDGAVIFDESSHGRLHFLARSLAPASRRPGASGNVHVKIGAGATLEVVPVETAAGTMVLGAVVAAALDPTSVAAIMDALKQVATPPAGR